MAATPAQSGPASVSRAYFWALALIAATLFVAPIRVGDLAGYDDARYALVAKGIVQSGDWIDIKSNTDPALEHPPLFSWMQAILFCEFGFSDFLAKLPSALCGIGVVVLVYWLARRITGDSLAATAAMFILITTIYFLKYTAHAMTDVPFTFIVLGAVCAWLLGEQDQRWYLAAGLLVAMAQLMRSMSGFALPILFVLDAALNRRRRPSPAYAIAAIAIAFLPPAAWYAQWIYRYGSRFFVVHSAFLNDEVFGPLVPAWRRYTGAFEYAWMIAKSYWPWLPAMIAGLVAVIREKDPRQRLLALWAAVVFVLCAAARSRVLRYMLPAYPAFSILAAIGILRWIPERAVVKSLRVLVPILAMAALAIAIFPQVILHAADTKPIALAATAATRSDELVALYDEGNRRIDESNEMLWYGERYLTVLWKPGDLEKALKNPQSRVFVVDRATYGRLIDSHIAHQVIAQHGHLVCFSLCSPVGSPGCELHP